MDALHRAAHELLRHDTDHPDALAVPVRQDSAATDQMVRRVNKERLVVLGWGRAILLQVAHPLVAAGVSQHSDYDRGAWEYVQRTHHTVRAMLGLTFGSADEVQRTADRINTIHRQVHGRVVAPDGSTTRYPGGTRYSATDPDLLRWVHTTLIDSQLRTYELFVGDLTATERDRYCAEAAARIAPLLHIPPDDLPTSVAEVNDYLQVRYHDGTVQVTSTARRLARALLHPGGVLGGPVLSLGRMVTAGLLPAPLRDAYGFRWNPRRQRRLNRLSRVIRAFHPWVPRSLREWPAAKCDNSTK